MSRQSMILTGLMVLLIGVLCPAQEPPTKGPAVPPAASDKGNRRTFHPEDPKFLLEKMTAELKLDETQQQAVSKVLKDHMAYMNELRQSAQAQPSDGYQKMRAVSDELRAAREANDTEKVRQLSEQLRQLGQEQQARMAPLRQKMAESQEKLRSELMAALREDQKSAFEKFWDERMARRSPYRGPERSAQTLKSMTDRLPALSAEQSKQIEQLFRQHAEAVKTSPKGSAAEKLLVNKLYDGVMAVLTPKQRSLLESQLNGPRRSTLATHPAPTPTGSNPPPPAPKPTAP